MLNSVSRADRRWWLVLVLLSSVYTVIYFATRFLGISSFSKSYILPALLWGAVVLVVKALGSYQPAAKIRLRPVVIQVALAAGFFQIISYSIGGLFSSFGVSSNSFTLVSIVGNVLLVGGTLAGTEISRAWLMNHLGRNRILTLVFVSALFTGLSLTPGQLIGIRPNVSALDFVGSTLIPALSSNLLASYLALLAGPLASLAYMGLLQAFWWFLPILPDLSWAFKGLIGTAVPVIALVTAHNFSASKNSQHRRDARIEESLGGWVAISVASVAIIWFSVGIFPIRPSLIVSGSMDPALAVGDIAIVVKVPTETIKVGDIIDYKLTRKVDVVHRVVAVQQTGNEVQFATKGDANSGEDLEPVISENVIGKVIFKFPKVGWLAVVVKSFFTEQG